jgi:hypothetical protein
MLSEEIAVSFFATITPFDYRRIEFIGIDPTLTIKYKKIKIKDLGIKYRSETHKSRRRYGVYRCHCGKEFETVMPHLLE